MLIILFLGACTSQDIKIAEYNTAPDVSILAPVDNQEFGLHEMVTFQGQVGDLQDGPEVLTLKWTNTTGTLSMDGVADADGTVLLSIDDLELGDHIITLRAVDSEGESNQASVQVSIVEILEQPQIVIRSPDEGETLSDGDMISFEADVFDSNDAPSELQVVFESSIDGIICLPTIQEETDVSGELIGSATCDAELSANYHQLTYTVTDTDGMTSSKTRYVLVESPDNDGDGFTSGQGDCDDNNANINPQASESSFVNGIDEDCDGIIDEGTEVYDDDGDGYTEQAGDCDDGNANINPDMDETCSDNVDTNCDGILGDINGNADNCTLYYIDNDGDTYGAMGSASACMCGPGEIQAYSSYTANNAMDCQDGNEDVHPAQTDYFPTPYTNMSGLASYDYNCDGNETLYATNIAECQCDSNIDSDNYSECMAIGVSTVIGLLYSGGTAECGIKDNQPGWASTVPDCGESGQFLMDVSDCVGDLSLALNFSADLFNGNASNSYFCEVSPYAGYYYQSCN